jgi:hypothetical protein
MVQDGEEAVAAGALPPPSVNTVNATIGEKYFKSNKLGGDRSHWFWFGAQCGLVMSAVSSWEVQTKEKGVHASNGYICTPEQAAECWTSSMESIGCRWYCNAPQRPVSTHGHVNDRSSTNVLNQMLL